MLKLLGPLVYPRFTSFRPIVDTTNSPHYGLGKYVSSLLNPLTQNDYSVKDTFEAVNKIRSIPPELFEQGYRYYSLDVVSLFTNVPLNRTIKIILKRVYEEKLLATKLRRNTLKKLIKDTCIKTAFSCNNKLYKQIDGVCMGSSLGPVLVNIIMTELEKIVVSDLINSGLIKFYIRYVDDTLLLAKDDIDNIVQQFNAFDDNLKFTIDKFTDNNVHFLDIKIDRNETDLFYKTTHTGQYIDFTSQTPWKLKTAWVKALYHRAKKICSSKRSFLKQVDKIKTFMSWNGYPCHVCNSVIKRLKSNQQRNETNKEEDNRKIIWLRFPYLGKKGETLLTSLKRKMKRCLKEDVKFITSYNTKKMAMFCSAKDKIKTPQKANIIYDIQCPACKEHYIGKTDRCFVTRLDEHGSRHDQPMFQHLVNCQQFLEELSILNLPISDNNIPEVELNSHIMNAVHNNSKVLDYNNNWSQLCFLEAFYIKTLKPKINAGLKASKELQLFK